MRRALAVASLLGGLVGFGAGAVTPAAADAIGEVVLFHKHQTIVFCDNWGEGVLHVERLDDATVWVGCDSLAMSGSLSIASTTR